MTNEELVERQYENIKKITLLAAPHVVMSKTLDGFCRLKAQKQLENLSEAEAWAEIVRMDDMVIFMESDEYKQLMAAGEQG